MIWRRVGSVIAALGLLLAGRAAPVRAEGATQVGIVVQYEDGRVESYCVMPQTAATTGYDALLLAGPPVIASVSAQGVAICRIGDTGCPANDCFCQCQGASCAYWAYFYQSDGAWQASNVGAAARQVSHGDVEGWRWGAGDPPPALAFKQICAEPSATASGAPAPSADRAAASLQERTRLPLVAAGVTIGAVGVALALSGRKRG